MERTWPHSSVSIELEGDVGDFVISNALVTADHAAHLGCYMSEDLGDAPYRV